MNERICSFANDHKRVVSFLLVVMLVFSMVAGMAREVKAEEVKMNKVQSLISGILVGSGVELTQMHTAQRQKMLQDIYFKLSSGVRNTLSAAAEGIQTGVTNAVNVAKSAFKAVMDVFNSSATYEGGSTGGGGAGRSFGYAPDTTTLEKDGMKNPSIGHLGTSGQINFDGMDYLFAYDVSAYANQMIPVSIDIFPASVYLNSYKEISSFTLGTAYDGRDVVIAIETGARYESLISNRRFYSVGINGVRVGADVKVLNSRNRNGYSVSSCKCPVPPSALYNDSIVTIRPDPSNSSRAILDFGVRSDRGAETPYGFSDANEQFGVIVELDQITFNPALGLTGFSGTVSTTRDPEKIGEQVEKIYKDQEEIPLQIPVETTPEGGETIPEGTTPEEVLPMPETPVDPDPDNPDEDITFPDLPDMELPSIEFPEGALGKFPFSIPFDLVNGFKTLVTPPEPPVFELPVDISLIGYSDTMVIDLTQFDFVAKVTRWMLSALFIVLLIIATRRLIKG